MPINLDLLLESAYKNDSTYVVQKKYLEKGISLPPKYSDALFLKAQSDIQDFKNRYL